MVVEEGMQKQKGERKEEQERQAEKVYIWPERGVPEGDQFFTEGSGAFEWHLGIKSMVLIFNRPEFRTWLWFSLDGRGQPF